MLIITIQLAPQGDRTRTHLRGTASIVNDGTGSPTSRNYDVRLSKWGKPSVTWRTGQVEGFARRRLGPWDLRFRTLQVTVGRRNERHST